MKLKVKRLVPDAKLPTKATEGSNGLDIYATAMIRTDKFVEYRTGLSFEIPKGYVGLLFSRSSVSNKPMVLANSVGVIDSDYRGEVTFRFKIIESNKFLKYEDLYKEGDRIGQLLLVENPEIELEEVKDLSETKRGSGSYGSSGV